MWRADSSEDPAEVIPGFLFLGSKRAADDFELLREKKITHILTVGVPPGSSAMPPWPTLVFPYHLVAVWLAV